MFEQIHVMGEAGRGPRLESLIVRASRVLGDVQFVGLSVTIANPVQVNEWIAWLGHDITLLISHHRPVPLEYKVLLALNDHEAIVTIVESVVADGGQCLVCIERARQLVDAAAELGSPVSDLEAMLDILVA